MLITFIHLSANSSLHFNLLAAEDLLASLQFLQSSLELFINSTSAQSLLVVIKPILAIELVQSRVTARNLFLHFFKILGSILLASGDLMQQTIFWFLRMVCINCYKPPEHAPVNIGKSLVTSYSSSIVNTSQIFPFPSLNTNHSP